MSDIINKIGARKLALIVLVIVAVIVACFFIFSDKDVEEDSGLSAPEKVVESYLDANYISQDANEVLVLYHNQVVKDLEDKYGSHDEVVKACDEKIKKTMDTLKKQYGELSIHWEIRGLKDCDKGMKDYYVSKYDDTNNLTVEDIKNVEVVMHYNDTADSTVMSFPIVKINGTWYLTM